MADNKTQHFVPRCYLRAFTRGGENKAINLFNLAAGKPIPDAAVKKQCASDYFYGDDLVLERRLQAFEGRYADRLRAILAEGYALRGEDAAMLTEFWLLQFLRTDASSRTHVQMTAQLDQEMGGLPPDYLLTIKDAVQSAMRLFFANPGVVADLQVRLVRNRSDRPFITSDNPAVMINRWHQTDARTELIGPGLQSAGMTGLLPLSSQVLCCIFDGDVYSVPHVGGWVDADAANVDAFNAQQVLTCQSNLYFRDWDQRDHVGQLVAGSAQRRLPARYVIQHAVYDREEDGTVIYRAVSAEEARDHDRSIIHTSMRLPRPASWPAVMRWRAGGVVYDSQSGAGFARSATREAGYAYRKLKLRA